MNTSGQIGSVISPLMFSFLLGRLGDWNAPLLVMCGLFLMGALCWGFINPHKRVWS